MLENLYTTKMSMDKKKLQNRFSKIRSKSGRLSKLMAVIMFSALLAVISLVSVILAATAPEDYIMTDKELTEYLASPVGSIMAELDYADREKVVFHYLKGFFVYNPQSNEIEHQIDLSALNVAPHQQGSHALQVTVDDAGKFAYLKSIGREDEVKDFDEYIINLDSGKVTEGTMPENTQTFGKFKETFHVIPKPLGWYSDRCVLNDGHTYYITVAESEICSLQLVDLDRGNDLTSYAYIFKDHYTSPARKRTNLIEKTLPEDVSYPIGGDLHWGADRNTLLALNRLLDMGLSVPNSDDYDVILYQTQKGDEITPYLFVFDNVSDELVGSHALRPDQALAAAAKILNGGGSELYDKTEEFINSAFRRVYGSTYDIKNLTITNWQENGNEASFYLNFSYLYYNRDPDKLEYIQDAKKTSEESYRALYDDYLSLHQGNYQFKIVAEGKDLKLYTNSAPKGTEWEPMDMFYSNPN